MLERKSLKNEVLRLTILGKRLGQKNWQISRPRKRIVEKMSSVKGGIRLRFEIAAKYRLTFG